MNASGGFWSESIGNPPVNRGVVVSVGLALLCSNRPVIHRQPTHWKVAGIAGRQTRSYTHCRSRDETVRLAESHAASGKLAPPPTGLSPLTPPEWRKPKAG